MANCIMPWTAAEVAAITGGKLHGADDWQALEVSTDTRNLVEGQLFVALRGANFKGEDFLPSAKVRGAVAAVVAELCDVDLPQIVVGDTLAALTALAQDRRASSRAVVIAMTGSNGKTSTKEMLARILATEGETLATLGNLNNEIGVPLTLLRLRDVHRFAVIEMGANHQGEIARLVAMARPDICLITNVSPAHLAGFGSLAGVAAAKEEIYAYSDGAMVINADLPWAEGWLTSYQNRPKKTFSLEGNGDIIVRFVAPNGGEFDVEINGEVLHIAWQLRGKHNVANALAAMAVACLAGIAPAKMAQALQGLALKQSRLQAFQVGRHCFYDDTYNANPASFKAGIDVLAIEKNSLVIAGKMAELGESSDALHREVRDYAQRRGITRFWSFNAPEYAADKDFHDMASLVEALQGVLAEDGEQVVLVKGSRSAGMERLFAAADLEHYRKG